MKTANQHTSNRNLLLLMLVLGGIWIVFPMLQDEFQMSRRDWIRSGRYFIGSAIIVFINIRYLLPRFYFRKKTLLYVLSSIGLILLVMFSMHLFTYFIFARPDMEVDWVRATRRPFPYIIALIGSAFYELSAYANRQAQQTLQLQREKLDTEVKFLKSQINPHFLFNTLNNLYSLSHLKPEKTPENILKLSEILRYMLYECNAPQVPLHKEIAYLENYVDLTLLKDSRGLNVEVQLDKSHPDVMIAPLLLIPFVENAFKHSKIEDRAQGWIKIKLETTHEELVFKVENSVPQQRATKDEVGGIGLQNVRRQLDLLYPQRHELDITNEAGTFLVILKINLTK